MAGSQARLDGPLEGEHRAADCERALAARASAPGDDARGVDPEGPEAPLGELVPGAGVDPDRVVADESRLGPVAVLLERGDAIEDLAVELGQRCERGGVL